MRPRKPWLIALTLLVASSSIAYEEAGHYYTVGMVLSGLGYSAASLASFCAQLPDEVPELDAANQFSSHKWAMVQWGLWHGGDRETLGHIFVVHQLLHSLNDSQVAAFEPQAQAVVGELLDRAIASGDANDLCAFGFSLHMLGDSFAHRRLEHPNQMYAPGFGHASAGTMPDYPLYEPNRGDSWHEQNWEMYLHTVATLVSARLGLKLRAELDSIQLPRFRQIQSHVLFLPAIDVEKQLTEQLQQLNGQWLGPEPDLKSHGVHPDEPCQKVIAEYSSSFPFVAPVRCDEVWTRYRAVAETHLKQFNATQVEFFPGPGLP